MDNLIPKEDPTSQVKADPDKLDEFLAGITETQLTTIDILQELVRGVNMIADNVEKLNIAMQQLSEALSDEEEDTTSTLDKVDDNGKTPDQSTL